METSHYPTDYLSCPCSPETLAEYGCLCAELASDFEDLARNRRVYQLRYDLEDHAAQEFLRFYPEFASDFKPYYFENSYPEEMDWISVYASEYETDTGLPIPAQSGPDPHAKVSRDDEWDGIYASRDLYQNNSFLNATYRDTEPNRCTVVKHWWTTNHSLQGTYPDNYFPKGFSQTPTHISRRDPLNFDEPSIKSKFGFEELEGFTTTLLIDMGITKKYHYKVFNIYEGNDQHLHVGRCTISTSVDGRPQATCKTCNSTHVFPGDLNSRNDQESFVTAIIRHGNNHGPTWLTSRSDFTYMHATTCDTRHVQTEPCNARDPRILRADLAGDLSDIQDFLIIHRRYCTQPDCRCTHYYHLISSTIGYAHVS
jgi:hypothetical protein